MSEPSSYVNPTLTDGAVATLVQRLLRLGGFTYTEAADRIVALEAERDRLRAFADAFAPLADGVFGCAHYHDALCSRCAMFLPLKASWALVDGRAAGSTDSSTP